MKELKERFIYFPFEYKAFIPYLNHRASKGWKLKTIEGNWLYSTFVFERCTPKNIKYYTDFSINSKYYRLRENQEEDAYHAFLEEYGYLYICDFKGLVVYECTSNATLELREENSEESKKELRRATRNSLFPFSWIVLYIALIIGTWRFDAMTLANYETLLSLFTKVLVVIMLLMIVYSPLVWMIRPRLQKRMGVIRLRTISVLSIACLYISLYVSDSHIKLYLLLCLTSLIIMMVGVFRFYFVSKSRLQKSCLCIVALVGLLLSNLALSSTTIHEQNKGHAIPPFSNQELHRKENDALTYDTFGTFIVDAMEVSYTSGAHYTIYYVNESCMKNYLQESIPYEKNVIQKIDKGSYTLFERDKDVVLSKEGVVWVMDTVIYRSLTPNELNNLLLKL